MSINEKYHQPNTATRSEFRPDEKWSWVVLFADFWLMSILHIPLMSYGILYAPVFESFGVSSTEIAWIGGIQVLLWNVSMIFLGPLCEEFGWRSVAMVGSMMNAVSMVCSCYIPSPLILIVYYSIVGAIGAGISMGVSVFVVSVYFEKRRGIALAIHSIGACVTLLVCPPFTVFLNNHFGSQGSCLILGAIMLNGVPLAALYHPISWHKYQCKEAEEELNTLPKLLTPTKDKTTFHAKKDIKNTKPNLMLLVLKTTCSNFRLLKQQRMIHLCIAMPGTFTGYILFQMWIPFAITEKGYSLETASLCLSASAIGNIIGRISIVLITDFLWFDRMLFFSISMFLLALCIFCFAFVLDITYLVIIVSWWGYVVGLILAMYSTVIIDIMGGKLFPAVYGIISLFVGIGMSITSVLSGIIRDGSPDFQIPLSFLGVVVSIACVFLFTMRWAEKKDKKRELNKECIQSYADLNEAL